MLVLFIGRLFPSDACLVSSIGRAYADSSVPRRKGNGGHSSAHEESEGPLGVCTILPKQLAALSSAVKPVTITLKGGRLELRDYPSVLQDVHHCSHCHRQRRQLGHDPAGSHLDGGAMAGRGAADGAGRTRLRLDRGSGSRRRRVGELEP